MIMKNPQRAHQRPVMSHRGCRRQLVEPIEPVEQPIAPGDGFPDAHDAVPQRCVLGKQVRGGVVDRVSLEKERGLFHGVRRKPRLIPFPLREKKRSCALGRQQPESAHPEHELRPGNLGEWRVDPLLHSTPSCRSDLVPLVVSWTRSIDDGRRHHAFVLETSQLG